MVAASTILDHATMADILANAHSRVPIYSGSRNNVQGYLLTKRLIVVDPDDRRELESLSSFRKPLVVHPSCSLLHLFRKFLQHKMNMALVVSNPPLVRRLYKEAGLEAVDLPADVVVHGMITIEDVIEELIQDVSVTACVELQDCTHVRGWCCDCCRFCWCAGVCAGDCGRS